MTNIHLLKIAKSRFLQILPHLPLRQDRKKPLSLDFPLRRFPRNPKKGWMTGKERSHAIFPKPFLPTVPVDQKNCAAWTQNAKNFTKYSLTERAVRTMIEARNRNNTVKGRIGKRKRVHVRHLKLTRALRMLFLSKANQLRRKVNTRVGHAREKLQKTTTPAPDIQQLLPGRHQLLQPTKLRPVLMPPRLVKMRSNRVIRLPSCFDDFFWILRHVNGSSIIHS